ncbi:MAG: hypothetical protein DRO96_00850 [Candidatus Aenigmatarchaeota archaeon]|nr:MAG: hypothetical protein B6U68_00485 [Candidatus Aenigmarchaeota archaeon ex4484_14]RLI97378.1 MAG: hypothetical protein DRO96_00850 [Candidatus Aenigmarchaeota archaeon]
METDDYELIPLNPIRRLEKRIERIESIKDKELFNDLLQAIKINQDTIDQLTKMNTDLIKEITKLSGSVEGLTGKLTDFLERIEIESLEAPDEEFERIKEENKKLVEREEKLTARIKALEKRVNALILSSMAKRRLVRARPQMKRPIQRPAQAPPVGGTMMPPTEEKRKVGLPLP